MSTIKKSLRIFWIYSLANMKTILNKPGAIIIFSIGKLVRFFLFGFFIYHLLSRSNVLAGYTLNQTMIFFLTFHTVDSITQLLFREVYRFRPLVITGDLDLILVKPLHPFLKVLIGGVDILDVIPTLLGGGLLTYFIAQERQITVISLLGFIIMIINTLILVTGFHIIVLALGIITTGIDHTIMIYRDVTRLSSLPIEIFQEPLRSIFTFVIPIGIMVSIPVKVLINISKPHFIIFSFGLSLSVLFLGLFLWKQALLKYQSAGG